MQIRTILLAQAEPELHFGARLLKYVQDRGPEIGLNMLLALLIVLFGWWVARILKGMLGAALRRGKMEETLVKFITTLAYALMLILVIVAALDRLGVPTTSLAAVVAAGGLAVGLALQGSLSNFAAGILVIVFKPFKVGDYVEAGGTAGSVEEIHIFSTILKTPDNKKVVVPNSAINGGVVVNYSALPTRRIDLVVGCGYDDDLREVKRFLEELLISDSRVMKDPAPLVAVDALADSSVNLIVRPWVKSSDYFATKCDLTEKIKLGFDEKGFSIPYPQQDVHFDKGALEQRETKSA